MAVDEALLAHAASGECCLRFYRWSPATLSLGYFQRLADRKLHAESLACPVVRRTSGGGAILHDDAELTYSLIVPVDHSLVRRRETLYLAVHRALIESLAALGAGGAVLAEPTKTDSETSASGERPFLCFQRRADGDVLLRDEKVAGSAQRRHQSTVLQHGSVLLDQSPFAPELPGLAQLAGARVTAEALIETWAPRLAQALGLTIGDDALSERETNRALQVAKEKFASSTWTERR